MAGSGREAGQALTTGGGARARRSIGARVTAGFAVRQPVGDPDVEQPACFAGRKHPPRERRLHSVLHAVLHVVLPSVLYSVLIGVKAGASAAIRL